MPIIHKEMEQLCTELEAFCEVNDLPLDIPAKDITKDIHGNPLQPEVQLWLNIFVKKWNSVK